MRLIIAIVCCHGAVCCPVEGDVLRLDLWSDSFWIQSFILYSTCGVIISGWWLLIFLLHVE
jgi:hypothetical protein